MTHICISKIISIGSDNGFSPVPCQAIIWTNVGILLIGPWGTNFNGILIKIQQVSQKKITLKMSSGNWRLFYLNLYEFWRNHGLYHNSYQGLGPDSIKRWNLTSIGNPIVEIRWSYDCLISTMGFPILGRWHLYIEAGPCTIIGI